MLSHITKTVLFHLKMASRFLMALRCHSEPELRWVSLLCKLKVGLMLDLECLINNSLWMYRQSLQIKLDEVFLNTYQSCYTVAADKKI